MSAVNQQIDTFHPSMELIFNSINEGIIIIDLNGCCTFINEASIQLLGYSREDCLGKNMHRLVHGRYKDGTAYTEDCCPIIRSIFDEEACQVDNEVFWRRDGTPIDVRYSSNPVIDEGIIKGAIVTFNEITSDNSHQIGPENGIAEKRHTETLTAGEELKNLKKKYRILQENETRLLRAQAIAGLGSWQFDPENGSLFWSAEVYKIWGLNPDTFKATYAQFFETIHPQDRQQLAKEQQAALQNEKELDREYRIVLADGTIKWVHEKGKLVFDERRKSHMLEGTVQDITRNKIALERLLKTRHGTVAFSNPKPIM